MVMLRGQTKGGNMKAGIIQSDVEINAVCRLHDNAHRLASLLVAEIKAYNEEKVIEGRLEGDLYERLQPYIDASREIYDKRVAPEVAAQYDYFHHELINTIAEGDPWKLGDAYPFAGAEKQTVDPEVMDLTPTLSNEGLKGMEEMQEFQMAPFKPLEVVASYERRPEITYVCPACGSGLIQVQMRRGGAVFLLLLGMRLAIFIIGFFIMLLSIILMCIPRTRWQCRRCGLVCRVP